MANPGIRYDYNSAMPTLNPDDCYQALAARDARFDGRFFVGVSTTGIYCRPICRVRLPGRDRCRFYPSAAAAEQAGFRPCLRCRPELAPGLSREEAVSRLAQRAAARIRAGALADGSLETLAASLNISSRQLRRAVEQTFGVSPIALAQSYRLLTAKQLLTDTHLRAIDVAYTSGFSSVRRFNACFRQHYRLTPGQLRKQGGKVAGEPGLQLRLGYRPPLAWQALVEFLASRGADGCSAVLDGRLYQTLRVGEISGWLVAEHNAERHQVVVSLSSALAPVFPRLGVALRHYFDLDASPETIDDQLRQHPLLRHCVRQTPGLRLPGTLDSFELAARAVIGQQVSVKAAGTVFNRFVQRFGEALETPIETLNRLAPRPETVAGAALNELIALGLTERRASTLKRLARAFADDELTLAYGDDSHRACQQLQALPGIGPWTAQYIALRALGDPDAFPASDLGLMKALGATSARDAERLAAPLKPWRAYAAIHLWRHLNSGG